MLLVSCQTSTSGLNDSWQTHRTVLEKDPIGTHQEFMARSVIEDEASTSEATALEWAKERYALLVRRAQNEIPGVTRVSYEWVVMAGADLVHRYWLFGDSKQAQFTLAQLNGFRDSHPAEVQGWASEQLHWANMEMQPAPSIPVLKLLGSASGSQMVRNGRVQLVSFFFLGCPPCIQELPALNDLQKRYPTETPLVADLTTYKANSYLSSPTHVTIEAALDRARRKKAPNIAMVITSDETLARFQVSAFPVVAVIDKAGRVRYVGREIDFGQNDAVGQLISRLLRE